MLSQRLVEPASVFASGPRAERGAELASAYGVQVTHDNLAAWQDADLVVLSVKPQVLPGVLAQLSGNIPEKALVLSIVAGARLATLAQGLGHAMLVRSMPNTPAQIGQGMTVWTASQAVNEGQREHARAVLGALG
jgi:pyrroline-5-carboxylate reductase